MNIIEDGEWENDEDSLHRHENSGSLPNMAIKEGKL